MKFLLFCGEALVLVIAIIVVLSFIANLVQKGKLHEHLEVENLNKKFKALANTLHRSILHPKIFKNQVKEEKKTQKKLGKKPSDKRRVFVIDFNGDIKATAVGHLREEVSSILHASNRDDEIIVRLESGGGMVHAYGLAASQLQRIRDKGIKLTVCVDKIAASGGYMMACLADKILAAPFAIVGSIGVLAPVPNLHKVLKKHDVDYFEVTAGDYKRTVSLLGKVTDEGMNRFNEKIQDTHGLFKKFVSMARPQIEIDKIANGDHWFGQQALDLNLVDQLMTSDEYIMSLLGEAEVFAISYKGKKKFAEKISEAMGSAAENTFLKLFQNLPYFKA